MKIVVRYMAQLRQAAGMATEEVAHRDVPGFRRHE